VLTSIVFIIGYTIGYAVLHSWLAAQRVKDWARRRMGRAAERWYRLAYNALAVVTLLPLGAMLVALPDWLLYSLPVPWAWGALVLQIVAVLGALHSLLSTDAWHLLGVRQLLTPSDDCSQHLVLTGLYRWVRHPVYLWGLVFVWVAPELTLNRLALNVALSLYVYIGSFFEERRLLAEFGDAYRRYQRQVPRLIPWRGPVHVR